MIPVNSSFKIPADGVKADIIQAVGIPTTGANDVSVWMESVVDPAKRQTNRGTTRSLLNFAKSNTSVYPPTGGLMIFHVKAGGTANDIEVNGVPTTDQIRLEIGDTIYSGGNSNHLIDSVEMLLQFIREASVGN